MTRRALILVMAVLCGGVLLAPAAQAQYLYGPYYTQLSEVLADFDNQLDALFTQYTGCPSWSTNCTGTYGPQTAVWTLVMGQSASSWDGTADHGASIGPWAAASKGVNDWKSFRMLEEVLRTDTCLAGIGINAVNTIRSTYAANIARQMPEISVQGVRVRANVTYIISLTVDTYVNITTGATNQLCQSLPLGGTTCFDVDIEPLEQLLDGASESLDDSLRNMTAAYMTIGDYRGAYYWKSFMGRVAFSFIKELLPGLLAAIGKSDDGSVYIPTDNPGEALMAAVYMGLAQATVSGGGDDKATTPCPPWGDVQDLHLDSTNGLPQRIDFDGGNLQNPQIDITGGSLCTGVTNFANNYEIGVGKYGERTQYLAVGAATPNQGNLNRDTGNTELNKTSYDAVGGDLDAWLKREGARLDFNFTQQPAGPAAPAFMGTHTFTASASAPTAVAMYWYTSDNGVDWTLAAGGTSYTPTFDFYSFGGDLRTRYYQARAETDCGGVPFAISSNIITVNNVTPPPITFTLQPPATTTAVPGQVVTMPATAGCPYGFITYQWQKWDGAAWQNVPGATNATLNLGSVSAAAAGTYQCLAFNQITTKGVNPVYYQASNPAVLNVAPDIIISQQPLGGDFAIGASHTMNITASVSSGTLTYQWQRNVGFGFQNMAGQTGTSLTLNAMTVNDAGSYRCIVTNTEPTYGVYSLFSASAVVNVSSGFIAYVDPTAPGPANGLSWATAFPTIQQAINLANAQPSGGEVWVAGGTQAVPVVYNEARTEAWGAPASVTGSLVMKDNVAVYGGFEGYRGGAGKLEANRRDRNRWQNVTTIAAPAGAYHVVVFGRQLAATLNSTLDGFIIQGGNAAGLPGDFHTWRGGGIFNWQSTPTIANCVVTGNVAATSGGGIANISSGTLDANAALMNVIVTGNTANRLDDLWAGGSPMRGGGGIFNDGASPNMTWVSVLNNAIAASPSPFGAAGAGMYSFAGSPVVNSSIFWANTGGTSEIEDNTTFGDLSITTVTYSDANYTGMAWGGDGDYSFPLSTPAAGSGNLYADPVLVNWIPQPGSPVIDTGDGLLAGDDITAAIRPVDGDAVPGAVCDMGAIEWVHAPTVACLSAALNISLQTSITDPLTLFDGTNSTVEGGIWRLEVAANTFGCAEIPGPTPVRVTVYDNRGQSGFCDAPVSAFETTNPVVVTNTITRQLNGSGSYALTNADVQALGAGSSDNCGVNWAASSVTPSTLTCAALGGPVNVTITVVDTSGNSASGTAQVVMQDVTAPTAVGASINVNLDLAGSYTLTSGDMQALGAGSTDNCSINWGATTATPATFDCTDLGANSVTVTVYDTSGNSATATGTVNVADVTPAIISGVSPKSFVTPGPDFTSASALAGVTANDGCAGPVTVTVECRDALNNVVPFPIPDTFDTGSVYPYNFTLIYSAPDGNGNTATQNTTLTLQNNTPPVITITGGTPVSVQCGATYTDQGATAMDAESGDLTAFVTVLSGLPVNTGSVGSATVRYQVQDPVTGVTVTRDRLVNIIDTTNPTVVGNNITRALVGNAYTLSAADIQAMGAGSFDSCGGINWATSTATPSSFTCANVGTPVNVTLTLRDNAGNSASATVQVTITDDTDPVLAGVVNRSFRTPGPDFTSAQALSGVSATDNCATGITPTVVCRDAANNVVAFPIPDTYPTGGVYPYTFTLTYTADDGNGNTATQVANLVLTQNLPPVITIVGADPATVECGASYTDEGATVTDPDDPAPALGTTGLPVDTSTLGQKLVVYSATDVSSGVTVTETREVNVVDTTGPVVVTNDITRTLPVSNTYTITLADRQAVGAGSTDSCGTIDWAGSLITPGTFNCSNVGPNNVTITVRDSNGNTNTGSAVITIVDATLPVISGVSNKAFMTPGADFTEAQALAGVSASDTCTGSRTVTVVCRDALNNVVPFPVPDTFPTGGTYPYIFTLTYTASDGNGNSANQTANLTLTNDNPPVITIIGANPATVQCGSAYTDEGATATDVESGTLTVSVESGLPVDTSAVASANVVYSVTDPLTSVVVTETRVVNIVDTTPPAAVCNPINVTLAGNAYSLTPADIQTIGAGSSDACGGIDWDNSTVVPSSFTCANVGTPVAVTLTVFDTAGLSATCNTTVTVLDDTDPVLAGVANKAFRTPGGDFTLAAALTGVTATDNCAGSITGSVTVECRDAANNVVAFPVPDDYPTGGVYPYTFTLNYSVSDGNGNSATQTANLVLTQNLPPVISVTGANPATVECGAAYTDDGATVDDPDDPDPALSTSGLPINTSSPNTFTVTYSAIDLASGVEVTATRQVNVVDTTGPTVVTVPITRNLSSGTYTVSVADRQAIAAGSTDSCGTIDWNASRIIPGTFTCANRGANTVEVRVVDSNGNQTISSGTLTINDVTAPVISGVSDKAFMTPGPDFTSAQALAGVSATDTCDGARTVNVECRDASNNVVAFPVPDTYPTGGVYPYVFTLTYTSTDTSANVRTQVANLTLTDDNPPVITITGANPATVECGTTYMDDGATATDVESGDLTSQISATGLPIPVNAPGTYAVVYSVTDPLTSVTVSESRQVDVVDTIAPTLTLFGSTLIGVATGGSYTDPLYTASDSCAGDLTGSVLVGGDTVNTAVPGTYVVTYNVTDGYNAAPQQTRTVIVTNLLWFSTQPAGAIVYVDAAPVSLTAVFEDGLNPTTYQWFVASNGGAEVAVGAPLAVPGDRTLTLAVDPAVYGVGSHVFVVRVTDDTGVRSSAAATVVVGNRMSVTDGLEDKTLTIGADFTWSITVTGGIGTLNYQWLKDDGSKAFVPVSDGGGISGSTTAALVITGFTADMAGDYQVEVSDDFDNIVVGPATLGLGSGLPAAGGLGLAALAALTALGGAVTIRRRK